jgi:hypothetical protein
MNYDEMFPDRWLKAGLFIGKEVTLTIKKVFGEALGEDPEWILSFVERDKQLVIRKTNAKALFSMWPDSDDWPGKQVTFITEPDKSKLSESGYCIRIKGSPQITEPIKFMDPHSRTQRPKERTLVPTGKGTKTAAPVDLDDFSQGGFDDLGES